MAKKKEVGPSPEEKIRLLLEKLKQEEALGVESMRKLNFEWLSTFRDSIKEDLRQDIDLSRQVFEKVIMSKNRIVKSLASDLSDAAQQAAQAQICHLQFQDRLQALQVERLKAVDKLWTDGQQELSVEFNSERDERLEQHWEEINYLKDVYEAMRKRNFDLKYYANLDYESVNDALERIQIAKRDFATRDIIAQQKAIDEKAALMQEEEDSYQKAIAEFKAALKAMADRSQTNKIIKLARKLRKLQKLRDTMVLQANLEDVGNQREREFTDLRVNTDKVKVKARQVKVRMGRERTVAKDRLTTLVMNTSAAEKKLRDIRTKGERLLFRTEMCAKLASEQGKVLPSNTTEEGAHATEPLSREIAEAMAEYREMEGFWKRYNKVRLEQLNLKRQEAALTRENQHLNALVRHYIDF